MTSTFDITDWSVFDNNYKTKVNETIDHVSQSIKKYDNSRIDDLYEDRDSIIEEAIDSVTIDFPRLGEQWVTFEESQSENIIKGSYILHTELIGGDPFDALNWYPISGLFLTEDDRKHVKLRAISNTEDGTTSYELIIRESGGLSVPVIQKQFCTIMARVAQTIQTLMLDNTNIGRARVGNEVASLIDKRISDLEQQAKNVNELNRMLNKTINI